MSDKFDRLINLLRELFQLDQPDLDFGLYRIMHAKSGEVTQFLEKDLLPQVKKAFEQYQPADKAAVKKKLDEAVAAAESLGVDPDTNDKVRELRAELDAGVDLEALESEVYDHLFSFFRRYYSDGDFLAKRVYKPGVYAVPYEGEEVVLHWANKDQYYIKTSEYLRDYAFRLKPEAGDAGGDSKRVHFRLVAAAEGEHGNNKAAEGKDRVFVLAPAGESGHDFLSVETVDGREELVIGFEYRPATMDDWTDEAKAQATAAAKKKPPKQKDLIDIAVKAVLATTGDAFDGWITELAKPHTKVNGETAEYSRLEGHLSRYCARHTFDYFIHKNLGGFLRRELDFYIKNEVLHLDDVQDEDAPKVEQYLSKIKVTRTIAGKVIDFLHQLEEFQRKLWLKKKFVVGVRYYISISHLDDDLHSYVAANEAQQSEWVDLYSIDRLDGYSQPLAADFLRKYPHLPVNTSLYPSHVAERMVASVSKLDEELSGVIVNGDNYQAGRLLRQRYDSQVSCVYLDPPYNAKSSEILYQNTFKHSAWLSMMHDRIGVTRPLLRNDGAVIVAIDENEQPRLSIVLQDLLPSYEQTCVSVIHNPAGVQGRNFSYSHEYALFAFPEDTNSIGLTERDSDLVSPLRDWGGTSARSLAKTCFYPIIVEGGDIVGYGDVCDEDFHPGASNVPDDDRVLVYPVDGEGVERKWVFSRNSVEKNADQLFLKQDSGEWVVMRRKSLGKHRTVWDDKKYYANIYGSRLLSHMFGSQVFSFPKSVHLVTDCLAALIAMENPQSVVADFFAGSATTGHACIALNRRDQGQRQFVLVEMGTYCDEVTVPRVLKAAYSADWKDGVPADDPDSIPVIVKCLRLESYEDAIANLSVNRPESVEDLLASSPEFSEAYRLSYMLDTETRGSTSLLSTESFVDPLEYYLEVREAGADTKYKAQVDLVETFCLLLGLRVDHLDPGKHFKAVTEPDDEGRLAVRGRIKEDPDGPWWFRTVAGTTPDGKRALIIWRKRPGGDEPEGIEQDNAVLDAWFRTQGYSTTDSEFDIVWVNGDNNLANLRQEEASEEGLGEAGWKVRVIEQDFHQLMFDTSDVPGGA